MFVLESACFLLGKVQPFGHTLSVAVFKFPVVSVLSLLVIVPALAIVTYGTSGKECYGSYNSTSQTGWGSGYKNSCIHSGTIKSSGDLPTTWYNYTLATAGTIIDENTTSSSPATNTTTATESICPKGWTLPSRTQIDSQRDVASFSPVLGGSYYNGTLYNEATVGYWWGSTAYYGARRYYLGYNGSSLYTYAHYRHYGYYVRCVQAP